MLNAADVDEVVEASSRFTVYDEMIDRYIYFGGAPQSSRVMLVDACSFEVCTNELSQIFQTPKAPEWVSLLNKILAGQ